jgi:hypothetical protein
MDAEGEELVLTITELQAAIDSLKRAKYSGVKRVQYTDRAVEYNSFADVDKALRDAETELSARQTTAAAGFTLASHSRD